MKKVTGLKDLYLPIPKCYQNATAIKRLWYWHQFSPVAQLCPILSDRMDCSTQASLSITNSHNLHKLMSIMSVMSSNHLILCHPLLLPPSIFPSISVFSSESALCIRWPKYWSFSFSISPSNEYSGLISFMMDWLDLLAVQGTLRSLLQHHSSKASVLMEALNSIKTQDSLLTYSPVVDIGLFSFLFSCCSVTQLCLTLLGPMDYSTPGFPVHHQLPELAQTHIH